MMPDSLYWKHATRAACFVLLLSVVLVMPSCAAAGAVIEDGGSFAGVAAFTEFLGPEIGLLSGFLWKYTFGWIAEWLTGTRSTRVAAEPGKGGTPDGIGGGEISMDWIIFAIAAYAFVQLGGIQWFRSRAKTMEEERSRDYSETWGEINRREEKLSLRIDALKETVERQQKEIDRLRDNPRNGNPLQ